MNIYKTVSKLFRNCFETVLFQFIFVVRTVLRCLSSSLKLPHNAYAIHALLPRGQTCFSNHLKAASVALGFLTGSGRLFQSEWPSMATAWRPYVLSGCRGTCSFNTNTNSQYDIYIAIIYGASSLLGRLGESRSAPGGRRLVDQASNLTSESACRLLDTEHSPIA